MKNTLHTPGPWKYDSTWALIEYGKTQICALHSGNLVNAHLISAAPDLLQVARDYVLLCQLHGMEGAVLDSALSAIAKAEGKTK